MPRTTSFAPGLFIKIFTTFKEGTSCSYTTTPSLPPITGHHQKYEWEIRKCLMHTGLKELDVMLDVSICRVAADSIATWRSASSTASTNGSVRLYAFWQPGFLKVVPE